MVMSVTPMVCMTLAFWLGRIGLTCSGGCCADAYGTAQMSPNRIAKVKSESRLREIMVALLVIEFWRIMYRDRGQRQEGIRCPSAEFTTFYKNLKQRLLRRVVDLASLSMSAVLLARLDRQRQAILFRWQRAGCEFRES